MQTNKIVIFLLSTILLCILSYYFVDRQVVWFLVSRHDQNIFILKIMANQIQNVITAFVFLFYLYVAIRLIKFKLSKIESKLLVMCNSIVMAVFLKDILKLVFGRYWANAFICNNPSLIENHVYGFNWFTHGTAFASFPSGHTTFVFSFSTSMWLLFPALRWVWGSLAAMVVIGQVGLYYHFVSDILAGAALGSLVAVYNYHYWVRPDKIS